MIVKEFQKDTKTFFGIECIRKLHSHQSKYQKIEVFSSKFFGNLLLLDDCFMVSQKNSEGYHLKCFELINKHKMNLNICVIGGGDFGIVHHLIKNKVASNIDLVEIDQDVIEISKKYFKNYYRNFDKKIVNIYIDDGVKWMLEKKGDIYDVIIVDSTDPNEFSRKLFSTKFYKAILKNLRSKGIFIQQSGSPILNKNNLIKPIMQKLNLIEFINIKCHEFNMPIYPLGTWSFIKCMKA